MVKRVAGCHKNIQFLILLYHIRRIQESVEKVKRCGKIVVVKKKYILTDNCYWYGKNKKKRSPHYIEVLDLETGSIKQIKSGSIIQIIKEK